MVRALAAAEKKRQGLEFRERPETAPLPVACGFDKEDSSRVRGSHHRRVKSHSGMQRSRKPMSNTGLSRTGGQFLDTLVNRQRSSFTSKCYKLPQPLLDTLDLPEGQAHGGRKSRPSSEHLKHQDACCEGVEADHPSTDTTRWYLHFALPQKRSELREHRKTSD